MTDYSLLCRTAKTLLQLLIGDNKNRFERLLSKAWMEVFLLEK